MFFFGLRLIYAINSNAINSKRERKLEVEGVKKIEKSCFGY